MEEITVETALGRDFDRMVRLQLDPIWHMLSSKTRQLVADLKTLRLVLRYVRNLFVTFCYACRLHCHVQLNFYYYFYISLQVKYYR